jgi:hypothetical protein
VVGEGTPAADGGRADGIELTETDGLVVGAELVGGRGMDGDGEPLEAVGQGLGSVGVGSAGTENVLVGVAVGLGDPVSPGDPVWVGDPVAVTVGVGLGVGVGSVLGGSVGDALGEGTAGGALRVGCGTVGGDTVRRDGPGAVATGAGTARSGERRGAAGSQPPVASVPGGADTGRIGAGSAGWLVTGSGSTTGPTDGVGMNGVLLSGIAVLPTVAEPALIAARIGIEAVPASSATVNR